MSTTPTRDTRRKEIIAAALDLFSRKGYRGTTMPDIAQVAGISTGLIYYIFPSKEDILLACCEDTATITRDVLKRAREIADPLQRFDTIVRELYTITDSTSKQLIILYRDISWLQRETRQRILMPMKKLDDYLVELFEEGQRAGIFTANIPQPRVLAANVQSLGHQWALQKTWHFAPEIDLETYISAQLDYFHAQLLKGAVDHPAPVSNDHQPTKTAELSSDKQDLIQPDERSSEE
jgi:AcrR family transcriptional regulator